MSEALTAALAGLEQALNAALALDPRSPERLAALDGRVVAMALSGTGLRICLRADDEGYLAVMGSFDGEADTTLRGAPLSMLRMASGSADTLFGGGVEIEGDVELGQRFQRIIQQVDIDWEEHLSRLVGDVAAHQLGQAARGLFSWFNRSADHLGMDTADYLREESRILPHPDEVREFLDGVDGLRDGVERLAARIARLEGRHP